MLHKELSHEFQMQKGIEQKVKNWYHHRWQKINNLNSWNLKSWQTEWGTTYYPFMWRTGEGDLRRAAPSPPFPNPSPSTEAEPGCAPGNGQKLSWGKGARWRNLEGVHSPLPGMSLPSTFAVHQMKTVTIVGPDTHICLPFLLTVLAFGHM